MRAKKYFLTLAVVYLAYFTHGMQAILLSQNNVHFAAQWGFNMADPASEAYAAGIAAVAGVVAYTGLAKFLTVWICGEISDKIGRKIMVMIGAIMYVVAFFGCLYTHNISVAKVCAFLMGAATSFFDGSLYAAAQESWIKAPGAATILIKGFISISGMAYPILVASLGAKGGDAWKAGIFIPAICAVILCIIAFIAPYSYDEELKEKRAAGTVETKEKGALDEDAQYAMDRFQTPAPKWLVVPLALMGFINMSTMYSAQQFLKTYGMEYCGLTEMKAASMSSLYTFGSLAAVIIWAIALAALRWRTLKVLVIDLCGSIVCYALAVFASNSAIIMFACVGIGFFAAGGALQCGVTLIQEFHPGPKGRNLGIYYTFMGLSGYIMPVISKAFTNTYGAGLGARYSLAINLVFAALGLLFCLYLVSQYKKWFGVTAFSKKGPDDIY